jgi:hypothetical protein
MGSNRRMKSFLKTIQYLKPPLTLPAKTNVRLGEIFLGKINDNSCQAWFVHQ